MPTDKRFLGVPAYFTGERDPYTTVQWDKRHCLIKDPEGKVVFEQRDVEVPVSWSQTAANVVASKYFYGKMGTPERETSVKQLVRRVSRTIAKRGLAMGYFEVNGAEIFERELAFILIHQYAAFNSPVWFNCGLYDEYKAGGTSEGGWYYDLEKERVIRAPNHYQYPQCSACFIQSVSDDMDSIMALACSEAMLFKYGSGTGTDLSTIRSSCEELSGGGQPSGPLSFLKIYDSVAGIVKSGGKTRRAAKMNTLADWHPDLMSFITAKAREEKKAHVLIDAGYDGSFNGEAYGSVAFQNENLSVRVSDKFMEAEARGERWQTHWVTKPDRKGPEYGARDILRAIAEGTHFCGDPGVQYADTINKWHTCKADGPINSSNPCSEYVFLDNTACNLSSINLMKFRVTSTVFDLLGFQHVTEVMIAAQEILVDMSSYPTKEIAKNSHLYRTLGLGYANLGALLMSLGYPYDSDEGRNLAALLTANMHFNAYAQSARIASVKGAFERYAVNKNSMDHVVMAHGEALLEVKDALGLAEGARTACRTALELGSAHGFRNAQVTVLAPTGTISFMMDCATTGVEPDIALIKYKLMASTVAGKEGGMMKLVNQTVPLALETLGYNHDTRTAILKYLETHDTIEGAPGLKPEHLAVFDCAFKPSKGTRTISYMAHLKMMAAVQPFLSGAISKTVNVPETATVDDIVQVYRDGWRMGLKAVAIYRDGSKRSQPLTTTKSKGQATTMAAPTAPVEAPALRARERMPSVRNSVTHKFDIGAHEGYVTMGRYPDNRPGEIFVTMSKEGSTIRGLMDCWATAVSIGLQYGVPFDVFLQKFQHTRFEPSGFCSGNGIKNCSSVPDYIFRWAASYLKDLAPAIEGVATEAREDASQLISDFNRNLSGDAPPCDTCGAITVRNGACYKCNNCGASLGCS